jgi:RNA polymerase sigma factor (sigma-70 family)
MADPLSQTVASATNGDPAAIEALLVEFLPGLRAWLGRHAGALVAQRETPDDLAQSVCREVLERLGGQRLAFHGEAQFRHWLYQAALHKLQNRRRHHRADRRDVAREVAVDATRSASAAQLVAFVARGTTPSQQIGRREDLLVLERALQSLTEPQRQIICWARLEGLSHAEVAQRLGVTESHSRVLLARAMARLARLAQLATAG